MLIYKGHAYREAMPYQTAPPMPRKLEKEAIAADAWLRSLTQNDFTALMGLADEYVDRTTYAANTIVDRLKHYRDDIRSLQEREKDYSSYALR